MRTLLGSVGIFLCLVCSSLAHDPFQGTAIARVSNDALELTVTLARATVESNLLNSAATGLETDALRPISDAAGQLFELSTNGVALSAIKTNATFIPKDNDIEFQLAYPRPNSGPMQIRAAYLSRLPAIDGYGVRLVALDVDNQVVLDQKWLVRGDPVLEVKLLSAARPVSAIDATLESEPRRQLTFESFLKLGIEHILTGYDHLLFLLGLLVVCRRVSSIVTVITCFTLAHSLTLALTALNVVNVSSRVIEPLIAATILFVGVENLARHGEPKGRWLLTLAFGLIHGFGLAGALKQVGLGANGGSVLMPLFSFNLGVEIGQLAVAAILLPVLWKLRTVPAFARYGVVVISVVVALAGLFWLVQRLFF